MGNIAYEIKEQIEKLSEKGVELDYDKNKVEEILLDIGYYRLGFYWFYFQEGPNKNKIKFSDIVNLYYLDVDLRHILIKYLHRIEINIKTTIIYNISNHYKNEPCWFASENIMKTDFVNEFQSHYDKIKEHNAQIKKHHNKYKDHNFAPAWKTLEFLSLGSIYTIFRNIKDNQLRLEIVKRYELKKEYIFLNYFYTIKFIRNLCAHSATLYDCNIAKGVKKGPITSIKNDNRHSIMAGIEVILFFLSKISENRKNDLQKEVRELFTKNSENQYTKEIITKKIKFDL